MDLSVLMTLGFLGLAPGGFGGAGPVPSGARIGAQTYGEVNAPVVWSQPDKRQAPVSPQGITIPYFKHTDFPFVTTMPDDGTDKGGGWQVARANLEFIKIVFPTSVTKWYCAFTIGVPLRTERMGIISPVLAASMSVVVADAVGAGMDDKLPQGIYCERFISGVRTTFKAMYPNLGSTVSK